MFKLFPFSLFSFCFLNFLQLFDVQIVLPNAMKRKGAPMYEFLDVKF